MSLVAPELLALQRLYHWETTCLLYTSDAADE